MEGGSGGTPPENFEVLHALKCVLGASEAPFCACIQYIHTHNTSASNVYIAAWQEIVKPVNDSTIRNIVRCSAT